MVNKRGWLRIVEASIAILIVFSTLIIVSNRQSFNEEDDLTRLITPLLEEIARNVSLREQVVLQGAGSQDMLDEFIDSKIQQSTIQHQVVVCEMEEVCGMPNYPQNAENVYAAERVISSTLEDYNPKKVKIFLWRVTA